MLPNTFIAGAQKSGTTTLCYAFEEHPQAVVSTPKEPAFFSRDANLKEPFRYEACFHAKNGVEPRAIIDGSNAYMVDPLAPARIKSMLGGGVRFVFCLREPATRAISGYWHQAKKGLERRPLAEALSFAGKSLDEAVQEEEERLRRAAKEARVDLADCPARFDDPLWNYRYLRNSLYVDDLERFRSTFGPDQVKVILFEDLVREPKATLSAVASFLDLDPAGLPAASDLHRNATALMRSPGLTRLLQKIPGRHLLRQVPGYAIVLESLFFRPPPSAHDKLQAALRRLVAPELTRLRDILARDLPASWVAVVSRNP
jgi:hypothetical protein